MSDDDKGLHEKIGYMRAGIKNVTLKVDRLLSKVDDVDAKLLTLDGTTVKHEQCESRVNRIVEKVDELKAEVSKKQTRKEVPIIGPEALGDIGDVDADLPDKKSLLVRAKENVSAIVVIVGAVGLLSTGFYKLAHLLVKVESAISSQSTETKKQTRAIKQELRKVQHTAPSKVIYLPVYPDAGPKRRRRVRPRRTP